MEKDEIRFKKIYSDKNNNEETLNEVYEYILDQLDLSNTDK